MINIEDCIKVGKLGKPHGVNGSFNIKLEDDFFNDETPIEYFMVLFEGYLVPFFVENLVLNGPNNSYIKFDHIHTPEQTAEFVNCDVYITHEQSKNFDIKQEVPQLEGFEIIDRRLGRIGLVQDSFLDSDNPLIQCNYKGNEVLIPFTESIVKDIDADKKVMITELPEGLLEIND